MYAEGKNRWDQTLDWSEPVRYQREVADWSALSYRGNVTKAMRKKLSSQCQKINETGSKLKFFSKEIRFK